MGDVIEILKLGLPGLVFLLSLFSFKLLTQEQKNEEVRPNLLKAIRQFMYINVFLAIMTAIAPAVGNTFFAGATPEVVNIDAISDGTKLSLGVAAVCHNAEYANRYLLVKDVDTGRLVQVFAGVLVPCTETQQIRIYTDDAVQLGWVQFDVSRKVDVVSALPGYKFSI